MPSVINHARHFFLTPQYFMRFFSKIVGRITDFSPLMIANRQRIADFSPLMIVNRQRIADISPSIFTKSCELSMRTKVRITFKLKLQ